MRSDEVRGEGVRSEGRDKDMMYAGIACKCVREHTHMGSYGCRREAKLSSLIEFFSAMSLTSHSVVMRLVLS